MADISATKERLTREEHKRFISMHSGIIQNMKLKHSIRWLNLKYPPHREQVSGVCVGQG
jgi:hypothetical protein